jgi:hypothetical protein
VLAVHIGIVHKPYAARDCVVIAHGVGIMHVLI